MIELTKLKGEKFTLNCDLIQMITSNPDTTILLTNGTHLLVRESRREVTEKVIEFRRQIFSDILSSLR